MDSVVRDTLSVYCFGGGCKAEDGGRDGRRHEAVCLVGVRPFGHGDVGADLLSVASFLWLQLGGMGGKY